MTKTWWLLTRSGAITTVLRNTVVCHTGDVAGRTENWSWGWGVWLVVAFTHQNHAALSADESDPTDWQGRKLRGNPTMAAAVRALATRRGHYLNDVLLPTGLSARQFDIQQAKITHPAISCSTYVIPPPDGRVTWIYFAAADTYADW